MTVFTSADAEIAELKKTIAQQKTRIDWQTNHIKEARRLMRKMMGLLATLVGDESELHARVLAALDEYDKTDGNSNPNATP
jgi:hypothetical protein